MFICVFPEILKSKRFVLRCIDKVFMEEKTEWETEVTCEHSYNRRCAKSLVTVYNSAQVFGYLLKVQIKFIKKKIRFQKIVKIIFRKC